MFRGSLFLLNPALSAPAAKTDEFVHVLKGTLPVIISAPNGGRKQVPDVSERKGDGVRQLVTAGTPPNSTRLSRPRS